MNVEIFRLRTLTYVSMQTRCLNHKLVLVPMTYKIASYKYPDMARQQAFAVVFKPMLLKFNILKDKYLSCLCLLVPFLRGKQFCLYRTMKLIWVKMVPNVT